MKMSLPLFKGLIPKCLKGWVFALRTLAPVAGMLGALAVVFSTAQAQDAQTVKHEFRLPWQMTVQAPPRPRIALQSLNAAKSQWIQASTDRNQDVELGSRVVLRAGKMPPWSLWLGIAH